MSQRSLFLSSLSLSCYAGLARVEGGGLEDVGGLHFDEYLREEQVQECPVHCIHTRSFYHCHVISTQTSTLRKRM